MAAHIERSTRDNASRVALSAWAVSAEVFGQQRCIRKVLVELVPILSGLPRKTVGVVDGHGFTSNYAILFLIR
jgi:hypothetical protein